MSREGIARLNGNTGSDETTSIIPQFCKMPSYCSNLTKIAPNSSSFHTAYYSTIIDQYKYLALHTTYLIFTTYLVFGVAAVIRTYLLRAISLQLVQLLATTAALLITLLSQSVIAEDVVTKDLIEYQVAQPARGLSFPADHGSHPGFETEWWYLTGHLVPKGGSVFGSPTSYGVQLTFFRRRKGDGSWGQLYAAHGALGDVAAGTFTHDMRYARSGMGLVDISQRSLKIALLDWGLESISDRWLLRWGVGENTQIRLITNPIIPRMIVPQGDGGYSKKAQCETCASMYYSVPQIQAEGEIRIDDKLVPVSGILWMDHEFMTNALQPEQVGWDWFSLMTERGQSFMLFQVRGTDSSHNYFSASFVDGGKVTKLGADDFSIKAESSWVSPHSGATYPQRWRITAPKVSFDEVLIPVLSDQEVRAGGKDPMTYWEGAITNGEHTVKGFAELTGYGKPVSPGL
jgi:predicted secreted hydrolase